MWGRGKSRKSSHGPGPIRPDRAKPLRDAMWEARIEAAERTGVVVDLRDAEVARRELINEELDPVFAEIPDRVDLFDRGLSRGDTPRLWIDASRMSRWHATNAFIGLRHYWFPHPDSASRLSSATEPSGRKPRVTTSQRQAPGPPLMR